jgi:hypothetical protein
VVRCWRVATMRPDGTGVRLAPPAPSGAAVGPCCDRHRLRQRVFTRQHKLHAPSQVASTDAQVREGPGAATGSALSSFVQECAALGPDAASCSSSRYVVHCCAATGAHAVRHPREHAAPMERVARQCVSCSAQRPDGRLSRGKGRPAPFLLTGVQGQRPAGGAGGKAPAGVQGQRPAGVQGQRPAGGQGQSPARQRSHQPVRRADQERSPGHDRSRRHSERMYSIRASSWALERPVTSPMVPRVLSRTSRRVGALPSCR